MKFRVVIGDGIDLLVEADKEVDAVRKAKRVKDALAFADMDMDMGLYELNKDKFIYLELLRESGVTNMFGATPYLQSEFKLSSPESKKILLFWMSNYDRITELLGSVVGDSVKDSENTYDKYSGFKVKNSVTGDIEQYPYIKGEDGRDTEDKAIREQMKLTGLTRSNFMVVDLVKRDSSIVKDSTMIKKGDVIRIEARGTVFTKTVFSVESNYGTDEDPDWYLEFSDRTTMHQKTDGAKILSVNGKAFI